MVYRTKFYFVGRDFRQASQTKLFILFRTQSDQIPIQRLLSCTSISYTTWSSLASSASVSAMNITKGFFARIIFPSSFPVRRIPSSQQFHILRFMILGRADYQPPPIQNGRPHPPLKPTFSCEVIQQDLQLVKKFSFLHQCIHLCLTLCFLRFLEHCLQCFSLPIGFTYAEYLVTLLPLAPHVIDQKYFCNSS